MTEHRHALEVAGRGSVAEYQDAVIAAVADGHDDLVPTGEGCWAERVIGLRKQLAEARRRGDAYRHEAINLDCSRSRILYGESALIVDKRVAVHMEQDLLTRRPGEKSDDWIARADAAKEGS